MHKQTDFEWPDGYKAAFVIGIDDVHPETSRDGCDCGGDLEKGILGDLLRFVEKYPQVTTTLFITPQWIYKPQSRSFRYFHKIARILNLPNTLESIVSIFLSRKWEQDRFKIDKNLEWSSFIEQKVQEGKFSIGIHGLYHFGRSLSPAREFEHLSHEECAARLRKAKAIFKGSGITITTGFSPPGWCITEDLLKALKTEGIRYVAGNVAYARNYGGIKGISTTFPQFLRYGILNIPRNWVAEYSSLDQAKKIVENKGIVGVHAHVYQSYHGGSIESGLTPERIKKWMELVDFLEENYPKEIWYTTFDGMTRYVTRQYAC